MSRKKPSSVSTAAAAWAMVVICPLAPTEPRPPESVGVGRFGHFRRVFSRKRSSPGVLAERIAELGAQNVGMLDFVERLPILPALAVQQFDLLGGFAPPPGRPSDVGTQSDRLHGLDIADHFQRQSCRPVSDNARASSNPLAAHLVGQIGGTGGAQRRQRAIGFAVHQIDHRQPRRHLRPRGALQPVVDLVLQQIRGLIEQVDPTSRSASRRIISSPRRDRGESRKS